MKVAILGASGIIGQHMRLCVPEGIEPVWVRYERDSAHLGMDLRAFTPREFELLERPRVVVNLAGENSPDVVERSPDTFMDINQKMPGMLARVCRDHGSRLIQISSQAVFGGKNPPYFPGSKTSPINEYGFQKAAAEREVLDVSADFTVARATTILGIRPCPKMGRPNPIEQMLSGPTKQVNDRWFSVLFAHDAAIQIWNLVVENPGGIVLLGLPGRASRYDIARRLGCESEPVPSSYFRGLAQRPINTAYRSCAPYGAELDEGLMRCQKDWKARKAAA